MNAIDWHALERLREIFLEGSPTRSYWQSTSDLACYDATFGERIGWKWDAALTQVAELGWTPPRSPLLDFGCGSGVAGRKVISKFGIANFTELRVHDKSSLAKTFAAERARTEFSGLSIREIGVHDLVEAAANSTLVVSHVLSELRDFDRDRLLNVAEHAAAILWVEPGTHADSCALIEVRERFRERFRIVAPCPHAGRCGLLAPGQERHWCHFFGRPPSEIFSDAGWAEFATRIGIDLRSVPFSYLVLNRQASTSGARTTPPTTDRHRVLGKPRFYKGYAKLFCCSEEGVSELSWPKRHAGDLFKAMKDGATGSLFRLKHADGRITQIEDSNPDHRRLRA